MQPLQIKLKKYNPSEHKLTIIRPDRTQETVMLHTRTFLLHDICHFVVESYLQTKDGFWGMLLQGYTMAQLIGKDNPLTGPLKRIEGIAGAAQSVYSGHMPETGFRNYMDTLAFPVDNKSFLSGVIPRIDDIMQTWKFLPVGEQMELIFRIND